jgi:hypothetical protein
MAIADKSSLEKAARAVCGYCAGEPHHEPIPLKDRDGWLHVMIGINGGNKCSAGPIWDLIEKLEMPPSLLTGFDDCPNPPEKPALDPMMPRAYYFGPWSQAGHHLYGRGGSSAYHAEQMIPWSSIDGELQPHRESCRRDSGYCGCGSGPEGEALLHHRNGWTALSFWDRSVDRRGNCNSTYFAEGDFSFNEMVAIAKAQFGERWAKMGFQVVPAKQEEMA